MIHNRAMNSYVLWLKSTNADKFVNKYFKRSNSYYMFRPLMWPCVKKIKYIETLQMFVNQCTSKTLDIKITRLIFNRYIN
jgi:hypothetical protein